MLMQKKSCSPGFFSADKELSSPRKHRDDSNQFMVFMAGCKLYVLGAGLLEWLVVLCSVDTRNAKCMMQHSN